MNESETMALKNSQTELFRRSHMVEAQGRGMALMLSNAPQVEFRVGAGLFIASFARPSCLQPAPVPNGTDKLQRLGALQQEGGKKTGAWRVFTFNTKKGKA